MSTFFHKISSVSHIESSVEDLQKITSEVVEKSQTGELASSLNLTLDVISVTEPEPEPVALPKATNQTGLYFKRTQSLLSRILHITSRLYLPFYVPC